jgi:organic radical activating enzyme
MAILLLEPCNFDCPHCCRIDEPMAPGYRLTAGQLRACLEDARALTTLTWFHFSGGEPTLWAEEDLDLVDLLLDVSEAGYDPSFTTNGSGFVNPDRCRDFFARYVENARRPLLLYMSVDTFHGNFDREKERAPSVDNVVDFRETLSPEQAALIDLRFYATLSKAPESLLPEKMIRHYESRGVTVQFAPLSPMGKGRDLTALCPNVETGTAESMGAYFPFHKPKRSRPASPPTGKEREEATVLALIGDTYYFHFYATDPGEKDRWLEIGRLGGLPPEVVKAYTKKS